MFKQFGMVGTGFEFILEYIIDHSIYDEITLVVFKFLLIFRGFPVLLGRFRKSVI